MRVLFLLFLFIVLVQAAPSSPLIRTEERKRVDGERLFGHDSSASAQPTPDSDGPSHPDAQTSTSPTSTSNSASTPTTSAQAQTGSTKCRVRCGITWGALAALAVTTFLGKGKEITSQEITMPGDGY